jgi:hypothetical protein
MGDRHCESIYIYTHTREGKLNLDGSDCGGGAYEEGSLGDWIW